MALRLMEIILPEKDAVGILSMLEKQETLGIWREQLDHGNLMFRILITTGQAETITDLITSQYSDIEGFRLMLFSVEATIPSPESTEKPTPEEPAVKAPAEAEDNPPRISREELHEDIVSGLLPTRIYILTVALSALVAAIGLMRGDNVVIIGAMVIAPLLSPNVALVLAVTMSDFSLLAKSIKIFSLGIAVVLIISLVIGFIFKVDPTIEAISVRTTLTYGDIGLALAAGCAGALAYTTGISTALIGVMVATALLPPLVNAGILAGSGYYSMATGAILLFTANVICINLSGVVTFIIQGIRPRTWWEAQKAKRAARTAIVVWVILLAALLVIILFHWNR